jgi:hypothetical protein
MGNLVEPTPHKDVRAGPQRSTDSAALRPEQPGQMENIAKVAGYDESGASGRHIAR